MLRLGPRLLARTLPLWLGLAVVGCSGVERPVRLPEPEPALAPSTLERADALFAEGAYGQAAVAYGDWLERHAGDEDAARALFHQALARMALAHSADPAEAIGAPSVSTLLARLCVEYPDSSYAPSAARMLDWLAQIEALGERLEAIKRIDLGKPPDGSDR